jgi:phosphotriesterase-related protein
MGSVMTVTGPVERQALGVVLPHEHVQLDLGCLFTPPVNPQRAWIVDTPVTPDLYPQLLRDPYHCRDNLVLDDAAAAADELLEFRRRGGATVVDLSSCPVGPHPLALRQVSEASGLNIVAGTGFYVHRAHPPWIVDAPWEAVRDAMLRDVEEGLAGTDVRAGILGELGTSAPVHPDELKVLRAAAAVQRLHGLAINVHLAIFGAEGLKVVEALEQAGADLSRVALSHLDEHLDLPYLLALLKRGVFVEFDTFGSECCFEEEGTREPSDDNRIRALLMLLERGYGDRLLVSQDVCTKMHWHRYGGRGYDHLLTEVMPALARCGVSEAERLQLMVDNPARLLAG